MANIPSSTEMFDDNYEDNESRLLLYWQQFNLQLPNEAACKKELYEMAAQENLLTCHHCGQDRLKKNSNYRVLKCLGCNKWTWFTAGTFFHHVKLIRPWLAAMWLMDHGVVFSASRLCRLVGIAPSSALYILKKLTLVVAQNMHENTTQIPSSAFIKAICKRSRQTPRNAHPRTEEELIDQEITEATTTTEITKETTNQEIIAPKTINSENKNLQEHAQQQPAEIGNTAAKESNSKWNFNEQEQIIYNLLSEKVMSCDELHINTRISIPELSAALVIMELGGAIERLPGDRYRVLTSGPLPEIPPQLNDSDTIKVISIINFIRINFHGISRKYLQNYLAFHWYCKNSTCNACDSILKTCFQLRPLSYAEILDYISPALVIV